MIKIIRLVIILLAANTAFAQNDYKKTLDAGDIKAYCIDFNWGDGGPNAFAAPGLWADADPKEHVKWYKDLGVNVIQSFAVSCNGYAWYKDGFIPEQPGLKHDFLTELVKLGHKEGMKVFGYYCIGSNTRYGLENTEESYGVPNDGHIPFTLKYLDYLGNSIKDALIKTGMDGFMMDWFFHGSIYPGKRLKWLPCEQQMWVELMGSKFPGVENVSEEMEMTFKRRSVDRCWKHIHKVAKETNPDCIIWLTTYKLHHPQYENADMLQEVDWLMNEGGDIESLQKTKAEINKDVKLLNCLAAWNKANPVEVIPEVKKMKIGLYGFTKPQPNSLPPAMDQYFTRPVEEFTGDDKSIAAMLRFFKELSPDYVRKK
jgi:hypothetical protein